MAQGVANNSYDFAANLGSIATGFDAIGAAAFGGAQALYDGAAAFGGAIANALDSTAFALATANVAYDFAVGPNSVATGGGTQGAIALTGGMALADGAFAQGASSVASGYQSSAFSAGTATGPGASAFSIGFANGTGSVATNFGVANGELSVALISATANGYADWASGLGSLASSLTGVGSAHAINGGQSMNDGASSIGPGSVALGVNSISLGNVTATNDGATALGDVAGNSLMLDGATGIYFGLGAGQGVSFFGVTPAMQQIGGAAVAGAVYTATEQAMLNAVYDALQAYGLLT